MHHEASAAAQALAPQQHRHSTGLLHHARGQGHGVGRLAEERRPHALAFGRHLVGQQSHDLAALQGPQHQPHAGERGRRRGQAWAVARGFFHLAQESLAGRAIQHGERLGGAKAFHDGARRHLETAQVGREQQRALTLGDGGFDDLGAFPAHQVRDGLRLRHQPQPGHLGHHAASLTHRTAALLRADAGQVGIDPQTVAVAGRQGPGEPAQGRAHSVQKTQRPARDPAQQEHHASDKIGTIAELTGQLAGRCGSVPQISPGGILKQCHLHKCR